MYSYGSSVPGVSRWKTVPVGSFSANAWGVYDMHGNVSEWCASEYALGYNGLEMIGASIDRENDVSRVLRGGAWHSRPVF